MKKSIFTILFPIAAYLILLTQSDYLRAVAANDLFVSGHTFMVETLKNHGGLWAWIGSFLTQFFTYPWLGALLLVFIWTITYFFLVDAFQLKGKHKYLAWIPIFALLVSVIDIGYWMYIFRIQGYWFSQSVSFCAASGATWLIVRLVRFRWKKDITWLIFIIAYFAMMQAFPEFTYRNYTNNTLQIPLVIAPISVVLLSALRFIHFKSIHKKSSRLLQMANNESVFAVFFLLLVSAFAYQCSFREPNFHAELRMQKAIEDGNWEEVITEAKVANKPTNLMVMYKNIALMHSGKLTDMFKINNCGGQPKTGDSLDIRLAHIDGSMVYYQFGQINYAYRWALENNVKYGMKVKNLKMLVQCAIMNQEFDLADKYMAILRATTFNKEWVRQQEPKLRFAEKLRESQDYKNIAPLLTDDANQLDADNGLPEKWILNHFSDLAKSNNQKLEDVIMCTSLWTKDEYAFCIHFYQYNQRHQGEAVPELYQQAAMMLGTSEDSPITLNNFPFDPLITARYQAFIEKCSAMDQVNTPREVMGQRLRPLYGDTYWWYYYFYTDFNIY